MKQEEIKSVKDLTVDQFFNKSSFYEKEIAEIGSIVGQFTEVNHKNGKYFIVISFGSSTLHTEFVNRKKEGFESMKNLVERFYAEALLRAGK